MRYGIAASAQQRNDAVMHDWPSAPDEIPSPQLVAALLILDALPTERVPLWAACWIAAGYDGQGLAELAGLHGDEPREVRGGLGLALAECGVSTPADPDEQHEHAAAMVAFTAIARLQASGRAGERWVVDKVVQIAGPYLDRAIISLPLGRLYALDDEWAPAGDAPTNSFGPSSGKPAQPSSKHHAADRRTGVSSGHHAGPAWRANDFHRGRCGRCDSRSRGGVGASAGRSVPIPNVEGRRHSGRTEADVGWLPREAPTLVSCTAVCGRARPNFRLYAA